MPRIPQSNDRFPALSLRAAALALAACFTLVAMPAAASAAPRVNRDDRGSRYTVRTGDSLSAIAAAHGLDEPSAWRRIFDGNPQLEDPDHIVPGRELRIPADGKKLRRRPLPADPAPPVAASTSGAASSTSSGAAATSGVWSRLAACESGGNWSANTGNGYYGGLQFSLDSWRAVGGSGYPDQASAGTQIAMAERLLASQGWSAWPGCSAALGLR